MSINHFSSSSSSSSELNLPPPTFWWPPQHQYMEDTTSWPAPPPPPPPLPARPTLDLNQHVAARENLFEKPLTPSDVGKLNRLVIPKQHAERYFPLGGEAGGLVLGFEDESGKSWKFRYSYWNSSQSYVLTKGWSRYVKEKQLDAGDVVLFQRRDDRLFIGWRRRGDSNNYTGVSGMRSSTASRGISCSTSSIASNIDNEFPHPGTMAQDQSTRIGNPKRLRLFGVNLEYQVDDQSSEPSTPDGSSMSSQGLTHHHHHHQFYNSQPAYSYSSSSPSHMDGIAFSRDVNQMRNRRG